MIRIKPSERIKIRDLFENKCAYSGKELPKAFELDHVEPLLPFYLQDLIVAKHRNNRLNIVPTFPVINKVKADKTLFVFRTYFLPYISRVCLAYSFNSSSFEKKQLPYHFEAICSLFNISISTPFSGTFYFEENQDRFIHYVEYNDFLRKQHPHLVF